MCENNNYKRNSNGEIISSSDKKVMRRICEEFTTLKQSKDFFVERLIVEDRKQHSTDQWAEELLKHLVDLNHPEVKDQQDDTHHNCPHFPHSECEGLCDTLSLNITQHEFIVSAPCQRVTTKVDYKAHHIQAISASSASIDHSRFGGECYVACPFHDKEEPLCIADTIMMTQEHFLKEGRCNPGCGDSLVNEFPKGNPGWGGSLVNEFPKEKLTRTMYEKLSPINFNIHPVRIPTAEWAQKYKQPVYEFVYGVDFSEQNIDDCQCEYDKADFCIKCGIHIDSRCEVKDQKHEKFIIALEKKIVEMEEDIELWKQETVVLNNRVCHLKGLKNAMVSMMANCYSLPGKMVNEDIKAVMQAIEILLSVGGEE